MTAIKQALCSAKKQTEHIFENIFFLLRKTERKMPQKALFADESHTVELRLSRRARWRIFSFRAGPHFLVRRHQISQGRLLLWTFNADVSTTNGTMNLVVLLWTFNEDVRPDGCSRDGEKKGNSKIKFGIFEKQNHGIPWSDHGNSMVGPWFSVM